MYILSSHTCGSAHLFFLRKFKLPWLWYHMAPVHATEPAAPLFLYTHGDSWGVILGSTTPRLSSLKRYGKVRLTFKMRIHYPQPNITYGTILPLIILNRSLNTNQPCPPPPQKKHRPLTPFFFSSFFRLHNCADMVWSSTPIFSSFQNIAWSPMSVGTLLFDTAP
jgi:hypothetical protein